MPFVCGYRIWILRIFIGSAQHNDTATAVALRSLANENKRIKYLDSVNTLSQVRGLLGFLGSGRP